MKFASGLPAAMARASQEAVSKADIAMRTMPCTPIKREAARKFLP